MMTTPAYELLAVSVLLMAVSIFWQHKIRSRSPEQRDALIKSNPMPATNKGPLIAVGVVVLTPNSFQLVAFSILLLVTGVAMVAQHRTLLRLGVKPSFVNRWSATSALFFLAGAAFVGALYFGLGVHGG